MRAFSYPAIADQAQNRRSMVLRLDADVWCLLDQLLTFSNVDWLWEGEQDAIDELIGRADLQLSIHAMIGTIVWLAGPIPDHMLYCDGSTYDQADYPALYDALDAQYKSGATFTLPDLVGQFVYGAASDDLGDTGGEATHLLTVDELPAHSHSNSPHSHTYTPPVLNLDLESPGVPDLVGAGLGFPTATSADSITIDNTGGDEEHNNLPPYVKLWPAIVAQ